MSARIPQQQVLWALWQKRLRGCALLWMVLCILGGCSGGQATPPPPTATNAPPTATPVPEPTATPVSMEDIPYYNVDNPVLKRTVSILHPESGSPPYPFVFVNYALESSPSDYSVMVEELLSRGYAVVQIGGNQNYGLWADGFCAWAWLEANATSYDLDMDRAMVFTHGLGWSTSLWALGDKALWTDLLKYCPSPIPSTPHIRGVMVYNGWFLIPDGTLLWFGQYALGVRVTGTSDTPEDVIQRILRVSYDEWRTPGKLDEVAQRLATQIPLYYVNDPNPFGKRPAFLLLHSGKVTEEIPPSESVEFAAALEKYGIPVQVQELTDSEFWSLKEPENAARIADAFDVFAQQLFAAP